MACESKQGTLTQTTNKKTVCGSQGPSDTFNPPAITPGKGNTQTVLAGCDDSRVSVWQGAVQTWVDRHMSTAHPAWEQGSWALFSLLPSPFPFRVLWIQSWTANSAFLGHSFPVCHRPARQRMPHQCHMKISSGFPRL